MKIVRTMLALIALCISTAASAQLPTVPSATCVPYSIPIPESVVSCGAGMQGTKFKTSTKECPSGKITESADYDMSSCVAAPTTAGGYMSPAARCRLTPDGCAATPVAASCQSGYHWTTMGSGVAHCVQDDFACPWGNSLTHDKLGNPSCKQNTCPSTQVLQADGISCACPTNTVWGGSSCVPAPPTCVASTQQVNGTACGTGFSGTMYQTKTTSCPAGPYGAPSVTTSGYNTSTCTALAVTCNANSYNETTSCGSGSQYRTITTSCPGGAYGQPSTMYGGWNTGGCACGNGAPNYPTCTFPPPAPPPAPPTQYANQWIVVWFSTNCTNGLDGYIPCYGRAQNDGLNGVYSEANGIGPGLKNNPDFIRVINWAQATCNYRSPHTAEWQTPDQYFGTITAWCAGGSRYYPTTGDSVGISMILNNTPYN